MRFYKKFTCFILLGLIMLLGCSCGGASNSENKVGTPAPPVTSQGGSSLLSSDVLTDLETILQNIYENVNPSVVNIQVIEKIRDDFLGNEQSYFSQTYGSGFIWDRDGHIVTNNHVISNADEIIITLHDGTVVNGVIVGTDPDSDLAVIKVELPARELRPVELAISSQVKVGQLAVSIGNPFGLEGTMTVGFISALGRLLPVESENVTGQIYSIPDVIQTDAPLNPGNSGGVLVNKYGSVIGVPSAIISPVRASAGIGLAIPSSIVEKVVPDLIENGYYEHPWLGISGRTLSPNIADEMGLSPGQHGALILDILPGSPAEKAGLRGSDRRAIIQGVSTMVGGDIITAIDSVLMDTMDDVVTYVVRDTEVGQSISLDIVRDGEKLNIKLVLVARPSSQTDTESHDFAWLGVVGVTITPAIAEAMDISSTQKGVLIQQVVSGSPADKAGLRGSYKYSVLDDQEVLIGGDVIVGFDGEDIDDMDDLQSRVNEKEPGDYVIIRVIRDGNQIEVNVELAGLPE